MSEQQIPARAKIVIIGGGVGGTSVAYHLAQLGETDVVLVDRNDLTSGSTFHSAGMVGQLRADPTLTRMNMHSANLYRELQSSDTPPSWVECGSIKIASTPERMEEIRRQIGWAKTFGLDLHEITPAEVKERIPYINLDGVVGACIMTTDGQVDPSQLALSMAAGARKAGVKIHTFTRVLAINTKDGRVCSVDTDKGSIECEIVVNCGGIYAAEIGRMVDVRIPIVPMSHQYLITENFMDSAAPVMASLRDPDNLIYFRQEVQGLLMGGYERTSKPWKSSRESLDEIPKNFNNMLLPDDWDRFEEIAANSQMRIPKMAELGIKSFINGPEAFTPDNEFCLGETEVGGFYVAAGYCAHGIAGAGGIGKVMAEWIVGNEPPMDLWHMDIRRFGPAYRSPAFTLDRIQENYEQYYDIHYPLEERQTCRPHKTSPAYDWHKENHAVFGEKASWERVNFYINHQGDDALRPFAWAGKNWSNAVQMEHAATRESAGLFDESSFAKIEISGNRAGEFLEFVCANDVVRGAGRAVYTQALNNKGGIECDFTVTQIDDNRFLIVTGTAFAHHDAGWLKKLRRENNYSDVVIEDITEKLAIFGIWGPNSRTILQSLTDADLSSNAFGFMQSKEISIDGTLIRATRITYVGELGWELYIPVATAMDIWKKLIAAGAFPCGYRAIESLRLEKSYLAWGGEINTENNPYEAGLGFAISKKKTNFYGQAALKNLEKPTRKLIAITFDDIRQVPIGSEPIRSGEKIIGRIKSGGQGYTIQKAIGYAYVPLEYSDVGRKLEVEFFGNWISGTVSSTPLHDPSGLKIKS
jgi:4-methylaminobutanoate oxidase (formaldehyde-forming)